MGMEERAYNRRMRNWRRYVAAVGAVGIAVGLLELIGPTVNGVTAAQVLLLVLMLDARFCGTLPALTAAFVAIFAFLRYFVTPRGFALGDPSDWAALIAFIIIAVVGGELASRAERRAAEAQAGRVEIQRLYQELQAAFERASEAEAARRNEQLKSALLDALTHNLRTPLTAIKAAVTALIGAGTWHSGSPLPAEGRRELLQVIDEESDRLNRFIEGLSDAGRPDVAQPLHLRPIALHDIIRAGLARAETITRDHRMVVDITEGLPPVAVNSASVAEAIYILVDNASKYSPENSTITLRAVRSGHEFVTLSVSDEGPGVPPALAERVFERFFRVPGREPIDAHRGGIGLGLPIARRLIDAQGGQIWIDTTGAPAGTGTTVKMTLPVALDVAEPERKPEAVLAATD
jgi:K+-sensing histidine kinase KdpD